MTSAYLTDGAKTAENNHFNLLIHVTPVLFILKEQCTQKILSCHSKHIWYFFFILWNNDILYRRKTHKAVHMFCHRIASRDKEDSHLASCSFRAVVKGNKQTHFWVNNFFNWVTLSMRKWLDSWHWWVSVNMMACCGSDEWYLSWQKNGWIR